MYQALLFDLDGTLTASGEGITKSVRYALEKLGRKAPSLEELEVFVGPPLLGQFMAYCGMSEDEANLGVKYYRERYNSIGLYENQPYDGVKELLEQLKAKGFQLGVASSKPEHMVREILQHFHMADYFQVIRGSIPERLKMTKAEVVEEALKDLGYENRREEAVMIGDRKYDVEGAVTADLACIGVTYGYGTFEELKEAGADHIVQSVEELGRLLTEDR
ncbi:MAG: HAD-IA family hydrolase [Blautia sp.]